MYYLSINCCLLLCKGGHNLGQGTVCDRHQGDHSQQDQGQLPPVDECHDNTDYEGSKKEEHHSNFFSDSLLKEKKYIF